MACACKVGQQLSYLEKKYGVGGPKSKRTNMSVNAKVFFVNMLGFIVSVLALPFMLVSVLLNRKKVINIGKIAGLSTK